MTELYDPKKHLAPPAASARLTYRGGPLLTSSKLFGVFVDATGLGGTAFPYPKEMSGYLSWIAGSDVLAELAEYNTGLGTHIGDATVKLGGSTPPPPPPPPPGGNCDAMLNAWLTCMFGFAPPQVHAKKPKSKSSLKLHHREAARAAGIVVTDGDIQKLIADSVASGVLPKPDNATLFIVFFPSGVTVQLDAQDASCQQFCGYHGVFSLNGVNVYYAAMPFPDCSGCTAGLSAFDALTSTTSHEICEAITDPDPGTGWYDDVNGEVGDICAWKFRHSGGYNVQLEWSNKHNACI